MFECRREKLTQDEKEEKHKNNNDNARQSIKNIKAVKICSYKYKSNDSMSPLIHSKWTVLEQYNKYIGNLIAEKKKEVIYRPIRNTYSNQIANFIPYLHLKIPFFQEIEPALLNNADLCSKMLQTINTPLLFCKQPTQDIDKKLHMGKNLSNLQIGQFYNLDDIHISMVKYLDLDYIIKNNYLEEETCNKINKKFILFLSGKYKALKFFQQVDENEHLPSDICKIVKQLMEIQCNHTKFIQLKKFSIDTCGDASSCTKNEKPLNLIESQYSTNNQNQPSVNRKSNLSNKTELIGQENSEPTSEENHTQEMTLFSKIQQKNSQNKQHQIKEINKINKKRIDIKLQSSLNKINEHSGEEYQNFDVDQMDISNDQIKVNNRIREISITNGNQESDYRQNDNNSQYANLKKRNNDYDQLNQHKKHIKSSSTDENNKEKRKQIFHNLSKYLMHFIIEIVSEDHINQFDIIPGYRNIVKRAISQLKQSGKRNRLSQTFYFNHSHYNCIFLTITKENIKKLRNQQEFLSIHKQVFGEIDFQDEQQVLETNIIKMVVGAIVNIQLKYIIKQIIGEMDSSLFEITNINSECQAKINYLISVTHGIQSLLNGNYLIRF